jgi:hypothetical protein
MQEAWSRSRGLVPPFKPLLDGRWALEDRGGYERALGKTSQEVIYESRIFLEFGYTF